MARENPRITLHFTPTSGSWLNLVEAFFSIITRQAIRRGTFPSVPDLITAIRTFIDAWNERCQPFVWTRTADEVLAKANEPLASSDGPLAHRVEQRAFTRVCGVRASGVPPR